MTIERKLQEALAKRRIEEVGFRYCRAIDRCDEELLLTTFHEDAQVDMGVYVGPAREFARFLMPYMRDNLIVAMHRLTNVFIELDADRAKVESYMPGCAIGKTPNG
jgi:SnoaL-like domain